MHFATTLRRRSPEQCGGRGVCGPVATNAVAYTLAHLSAAYRGGWILTARPKRRAQRSDSQERSQLLHLPASQPPTQHTSATDQNTCKPEHPPTPSNKPPNTRYQFVMDHGPQRDVASVKPAPARPRQQLPLDFGNTARQHPGTGQMERWPERSTVLFTGHQTGLAGLRWPIHVQHVQCSACSASA